MTSPQPSFRYPMRTKLVVILVLAVAIGGFALAYLTTDTDTDDGGVAVSGSDAGEATRGDDPVVDVEPSDGSTVVLAQEPFSIQLAPGWTGELTFIPGNGSPTPLPEDEVVVTALNQLIYVPAEGRAVERLPEGTTSCVLATIWDQVEGREATETTEQWCFAVT